MAFRQKALTAAGGFDERFPRAYREDADLGLRITRSAWSITAGHHWVWRPLRPTDRRVSIRLQRGNVDDALVGAIHGRR